MAALSGEPPDLRWPEVGRDYILEATVRDLAWRVWDELRIEAESRGVAVVAISRVRPEYLRTVPLPHPRRRYRRVPIATIAQRLGLVLASSATLWLGILAVVLLVLGQDAERVTIAAAACAAIALILATSGDGPRGAH